MILLLTQFISIVFCTSTAQNIQLIASSDLSLPPHQICQDQGLVQIIANTANLPTLLDLLVSNNADSGAIAGYNYVAGNFILFQDGTYPAVGTNITSSFAFCSDAPIVQISVKPTLNRSNPVRPLKVTQINEPHLRIESVHERR